MTSSLNHPPFSKRVVRENRQVVGECAVRLDDLARDRSVQIADGLDAFDLAERLARFELAPTCGNSINTRSVNCFTAKSVMPTVASPRPCEPIRGSWHI